MAMLHQDSDSGTRSRASGSSKGEVLLKSKTVVISSYFNSDHSNPSLRAKST
jgi:hypothetical protein